MSQQKDQVKLRLELIAAKAKQLANDLSAGRLWPGDLNKGLCEIQEQLTHAALDARSDR